MNENLTDVLVNDLYDLTKEPIPKDVLTQAKECVLDYLGAGLAGAAIIRHRFEQYLNYFDSQQKEAAVIGFDKKASLHNAVLINGYSGHIVELDDGHRFSNVHLGATVIPAVLAVTEHENLTGKDLLRGIVVGYEAAIRLLHSIQPSHKALGHHASGTGGTIGAAIGIAAALKFSREQLKNALSAAAASAVGLLEVIEDDSELKPYNIGRAGHDGLTAAFMARAGFKGPKDILGGKRGFFALVADKYDIKNLKGDEGGAYGIEKIYRKPYAACRHCHAPIEAALGLKAKYNIAVRDIKRIDVRTYLAALIGHDHRDIQGITSAKMSTPYSVAVALSTGKAGLNEFLPEYIENRDIRRLCEKVGVEEHEELSALVPEKRGAIVEIVFNDGRSVIERVDYPKGEPENPISTKELEEKFLQLALYGEKTAEEAEEIIEKVWNIKNDLIGVISLL